MLVQNNTPLVSSAKITDSTSTDSTSQMDKTSFDDVSKDTPATSIAKNVTTSSSVSTPVTTVGQYIPSGATAKLSTAHGTIEFNLGAVSSDVEDLSAINSDHGNY